MVKIDEETPHWTLGIATVPCRKTFIEGLFCSDYVDISDSGQMTKGEAFIDTDDISDVFFIKGKVVAKLTVRRLHNTDPETII